MRLIVALVPSGRDADILVELEGNQETIIIYFQINLLQHLPNPNLKIWMIPNLLHYTNKCNNICSKCTKGIMTHWHPKFPTSIHNQFHNFNSIKIPIPICFHELTEENEGTRETDKDYDNWSFVLFWTTLIEDLFFLVYIRL